LLDVYLCVCSAPLIDARRTVPHAHKGLVTNWPHHSITLVGVPEVGRRLRREIGLEDILSSVGWVVLTNSGTSVYKENDGCDVQSSSRFEGEWCSSPRKGICTDGKEFTGETIGRRRILDR